MNYKDVIKNNSQDEQEKPDLLSRKEVAAILKFQTSLQTVYNWMKRGVKLRNTGERVYLEHITIGGRYYTSRDDLDSFLSRLQTHGGGYGKEPERQR